MTDLLSSQEIVPVEAQRPGRACPHCGQEFPGLGGAMALGRHTKAKHPEHWAGGRADARARTKPAARPRRQAAPKAPAQPKAAAPKVVGRHNLSAFFSKNLARGSKALAGISVAGARSLEFSAPAAGPALDALIAGTRLDKPAQRIASVGDKWEKIGAALSLPILVTMIDLNPMLGPVLEDELRDAVEAILEDAIPAMIAKRKRQDRLRSQLMELEVLDPAFGQMDDPIGAIIAGFFVRPEETVDAEPPA